MHHALARSPELTPKQDWERLSKCIAPTLRVSPPPSPFSSLKSNLISRQVDYRSFLDKMWDAMPAEEFLAMASDPKFLGNPLLKTQHFIGGSSWAKVSDDEIVGSHQMRVAHQKYTDPSCKTVAVKGHAHGVGVMRYRNVGGGWKFAGLSPDTRWYEYDYDKVFVEGRDHFGEDKAATE